MFFPLRFLIVAFLVATSVPAWSAEGGANAIFLVAGRNLADPNFAQTVVLVTHPPEGAPIGVIINRPLPDLLADVLSDQPLLKGRKDVLYFGGPVSRQGLVFLVRSPKPPPGATPVLPNVFFVSDPDLIEKLLQRKNPLEGLRVYAGYSGWGPGQLQREIARGDWFVTPADAATVFDRDPKGIWPELIERATTRQTKKPGGRESESSLLHFTKVFSPLPISRPDYLPGVQSIRDGSPLNSIAHGSPPWKSVAGPGG
jgi:putative transcriptional regulator